MGAITKAFYERLAGDPLLASMLGTYQGRACIFTVDPVPPTAPLPLIVTSGEVTGSVNVPEAAKQRIGVRITRDVRCYTDATGSIDAAEQIAERVWRLFHRSHLYVAGWDTVRTNADRPILTEADGRIYGLTVSVTVALQDLEGYSKGGS